MRVVRGNRYKVFLTQRLMGSLVFGHCTVWLPRWYTFATMLRKGDVEVGRCGPYLVVVSIKPPTTPQPPEKRAGAAHLKKFGKLLATFGTRMACLLRHLGPECSPKERQRAYRLYAKARDGTYGTSASTVV